MAAAGASHGDRHPSQKIQQGAFFLPFFLAALLWRVHRSPGYKIEFTPIVVLLHTKCVLQVLTAMRLLHPQAVTATPHWMSEGA